MKRMTSSLRNGFGYRIIKTALFVCVSLGGAAISFAQQFQGDSLSTLGLVGFNYTDRHISDYSVNNASGGHINLSSPSSGGSGIACCFRVAKHALYPIQVRIRWQVDGCKILETSMQTGATVETKRFAYKEIELEVKRVPGLNPNFIETHFYPDGTVQVDLTERISDPRLSLQARRPDKSNFSDCKNGKRLH